MCWKKVIALLRIGASVNSQKCGKNPYLGRICTERGQIRADVDYAQLVKLYGATSESAKGRYSPAECIGAEAAD
jgi:hypothetical protein